MYIMENRRTAFSCEPCENKNCEGLCKRAEFFDKTAPKCNLVIDGYLKSDRGNTPLPIDKVFRNINDFIAYVRYNDFDMGLKKQANIYPNFYCDNLC